MSSNLTCILYRRFLKPAFSYAFTAGRFSTNTSVSEIMQPFLRKTSRMLWIRLAPIPFPLWPGTDAQGKTYRLWPGICLGLFWHSDKTHQPCRICRPVSWNYHNCSHLHCLVHRIFSILALQEKELRNQLLP